MRLPSKISATIIVLCISVLLCAGSAQARSEKKERKGHVIVSFGVSAYQGSDTQGIGWLAEVGAGYQFNDYFSLMATTGYGQYGVEDTRSGHDGTRRVEFIPLMLTATVDLAPNFPINPYLSAGGGTTFSRFAGDDQWEASPSLQAGGGVNISAGPLGFSVGANYIIQDVSDFSEGYWSYGVGGGAGFSAAF
ncbi:MAG: outer membrane beta-barrel protein [Candidatus Alcyoniella australis]|nr:outer membrane beta-barrel protein [Candidatus Alcyoniella australis]